jgi:hypothetical protein
VMERVPQAQRLLALARGPGPWLGAPDFGWSPTWVAIIPSQYYLGLFFINPAVFCTRTSYSLSRLATVVLFCS